MPDTYHQTQCAISTCGYQELGAWGPCGWWLRGPPPLVTSACHPDQQVTGSNQDLLLANSRLNRCWHRRGSARRGWWDARPAGVGVVAVLSWSTSHTARFFRWGWPGALNPCRAESTVSTARNEDPAARATRSSFVSARGQNAPTPLGVPRPDGPSQPTRAVHHWGVGQVPSDPEMTSKRDEVWLYGRAFGYAVVMPDSA